MNKTDLIIGLTASVKVVEEKNTGNGRCVRISVSHVPYVPEAPKSDVDKIISHLGFAEVKIPVMNDKTNKFIFKAKNERNQ